MQRMGRQQFRSCLGEFSLPPPLPARPPLLLRMQPPMLGCIAALVSFSTSGVSSANSSPAGYTTLGARRASEQPWQPGSSMRIWVRLGRYSGQRSVACSAGPAQQVSRLSWWRA